MPDALRLDNLTKHFGTTPALQGATLAVKPGQLIGLLGPSGCGKTTLLRLIAGFEQPDQGQVIIDGRVVASPQHSLPAEQRRVGMVFQEYALFQHLSVAQNVGFGLTGSPQTKAARVADMLALVGLADLGQRMPHELSGGQQQRVALARALAPEPAILLLDEPFSNLDAGLRTQVRTEVRAILKQTRTTCIFVTHDQEEALSLADEVAVMLDGHILQIAPPQTLYHQPQHRAVATFVGEANLLPGTASGPAATCALGTVPLAADQHGPVEVMLRPEDLHLAPANGSGLIGQITWREFYGHDQRLGLTLPDGTALIARLGPEATFQPGDRVSVRPRDAAIAFPLD